jgi:hypothetical protein
MLFKDISLTVTVDNQVEGIKAEFKTIGDKILLTADKTLYDPHELLAAITDCIAFQDKLTKELEEINRTMEVL